MILMLDFGAVYDCNLPRFDGDLERIIYNWHIMMSQQVVSVACFPFGT